MKIYDKQDRLILDVSVDDNSYRNRAVMGDHNLTLYYSLPEHVEIPIGAYCIYEEETYILMRPEHLKIKHTRSYDYTVVFSSDQEKTKIWKFRNVVDGRLKFSLTAKPKEHLQMLVDNMNMRDAGWTVGECIDDVEKLISYDHDFCWDALNKQATEFKTEFEIVRKQISLKKVEYNKSTPLALAYGEGNGFKSDVGRSNTSEALPVEILFVQGGNTNIDRSKYPDSERLWAINNGCLLLPTEQIIAYDGEYFEGEDAFNQEQARHYQVDDLGLSIRNIDKEMTTQAEDSLDRSDDYPKRVGTISSVVMVDKEKNLYDIIDDSIPEDLNYEDYLIGEEKMTIIFQTGELAGKEFDVKYYHAPKTLNGKEKAGRRFEIIPQEIDGVMMPGDSFVPAVGDIYVVFHVMLPDSYIRNDATKSGASWDMFRAAVRYLFDNEQKKFSFTGVLDSIWAKKNWLNIGGKIRLGGYIQFTHDQVAPEGALVRIISIKDYVNKPHSPKIELSNDTISVSVSSTLKQLASTEVLIDENHRSALQFSKRRFRDAKETIEMIESALSDNFTNRINPIAVETMSLLVGDERLQYRFVEAPGDMTAVPHNIIFHEDTKQLEASSGTIQHLTIGINSIRSSHESNEYLYWNVTEFLSPILTDGSTKYYLYIRAQKQYNGTAGSAEFRLETTVHKLEEDNFYWFLVGILNTEYDGKRSFATLYGFTEVLPGRITADRILASDGESYFDMLNAALKLKDKLIFNKDGDGELRVKGVIVQSQNGLDEAPLGCFRGEYDNETTYFNGDEVTYLTANNGHKSTYRCISLTPITGILPTNTLKWQVTAAGASGNYTEYRFAVNGSTTQHPDINYSSLNPTGWATAMPTLNNGNYMWMTKAVKNGAGTALVSLWSTPVRITPKDGKDGKDGVAPVLLFRGVYSPDTIYSGNQYRVDCVKQENTYYVARTDAGDFSGVMPPNASKWNPFGSSFESVATGLLLAENANIADFIFRNECLESSSTDIDGNPNIILGGKTGVSYHNGSIVNPFKRIKRSNLKDCLSAMPYSETLYKFDLDKTGMKIMIQFTNSDLLAEFGSRINTLILLPDDVKYINTEFEIYNASTDTIGLSGQLVIGVDWAELTQDSVFSNNSIFILPGNYYKFRCFPLIKSHFNSSTWGNYKQVDGFQMPWILVEKKEL